MDIFEEAITLSQEIFSPIFSGKALFEQEFIPTTFHSTNISMAMEQ